MDCQMSDDRILSDLYERLKGINSKGRKFTFLTMVSLVMWYGILLTFFMFAKKSQDPVKDTNYVFTNTFQFLACAWAVAFMWPYFMRVETKTDISLRLAIQSIATLESIKDSSMPVIEDLKGVIRRIHDIADMVDRDDFSRIKSGLKRVLDILEGRDPDAVEKIKALVRQELASAESEVENFIWRRVDSFLGTVFTPPSDGQGHEGVHEEVHKDDQRERVGGNGTLQGESERREASKTSEV